MPALRRSCCGEPLQSELLLNTVACILTVIRFVLSVMKRFATVDHSANALSDGGSDDGDGLIEFEAFGALWEHLIQSSVSSAADAVSMERCVSAPVRQRSSYSCSCGVTASSTCVL